jgi:hypothetical protein
MATGGLFGQGGGFSSATVSDAGGAVSDLFAAEGDLYKKQGDLIEQGMYTSDAALATQNAQFTQTSTAIKLAQQSRANFQSQSETEANVASAGFAQSGSSLDILSNNASQGALTQQVLQQQGLITEAGYTEQATAYTDQAQAEGVAAKAAGTAATGAEISGAFKGAAALATLAIA